MSRLLILLAAFATVALAVSVNTNGVCVPMKTPSGYVSLENSTSVLLQGIPIHEHGNPANNKIDIGVNFCVPFDTTSTPCKHHSAGLISLSQVGEDPVCLAVFDTFLNPWAWNGTAVVGVMTDSNSQEWATVSVVCGEPGVEYAASISESADGTSFDIMFASDFACVTPTSRYH